MTKLKYDGDCEKLAKRIMYLAWKASRCLGLGFLQDRGEQNEEEVWASMMGRRDYGGFLANTNQTGDVYADYVNGRMMKLGIKWSEGEISLNNDNFDREYQSFARLYPTAQSLFDKAVESLKGVKA